MLVVGFSRLYLGAHWLSDVLAGYALGATWVAIVSAVTLSRWRTRRDSKLRRFPPSGEPSGQAA